MVVISGFERQGLEDLWSWEARQLSLGLNRERHPKSASSLPTHTQSHVQMLTCMNMYAHLHEHHTHTERHTHTRTIFLGLSKAEERLRKNDLICHFNLFEAKMKLLCLLSPRALFCRDPWVDTDLSERPGFIPQLLRDKCSPRPPSLTVGSVACVCMKVSTKQGVSLNVFLRL